MRVGKNPFKNQAGKFNPARLGIVSLVYIPFLDGYYEHSLEVLEIHLESLQLTKPADSNLLVFDNGSCREVVEFLQSEQRRGAVDWLVLSNHNMSKVGAINWAFSVLENEYLAYTDSDILFRTGWAEESLDIFAKFDKAGIVAAQPPFFDLLKDELLSLENIRADADYQVDQALPEMRWIEEYCRGVGLPEEKRRQYETTPLYQVSGKTGDAKAWIGATHAQFMVENEVGKAMIPLPVSGRLIPADAKEINRKPERMGYWQLSTIDSYFFHMGNMLNEMVLEEIARLRKATGSTPRGLRRSTGEQAEDLKGAVYSGLKRMVKAVPGLRRLLERMYGILFKLVEDR